MKLKELEEKKVRRQSEIVGKAEKEQRDLTTEEKAELEVLQRDILELRDMMRGDGNEDGLTREEGGESGEGDADAQNERKRASSIATLCREFGMDAEEYIERGASVEEVQTAVIEQLRGTNGPLQTRGSGDLTVTKSEEDKFREAAADALLMRGGISVSNASPGAEELRALSLRDLAIETFNEEGQAGLNRKSSDELFTMVQRAYFNPSAAFPAIMDTAINKAYVEGHKNVNVTFEKFTKKGSLKDFKVHDNYYLAGPAGEFLELPEGGEIKHDRPTDVKMPTRKLKTYARQFTMTREAFINDDIDFLSKVPAKYAAAARKTINKQVYGIMCANPVVYDGIQLFSTAHKNVLTKGSGITRESMQKMIMALQTQVDQHGEAMIVNPAVIVVPSGYAFDIYTMLYSPTIHTSENTQATNPMFRYREMIEVVEDPTINVLCGGFGKVMPWFLIGSKTDTDFIEVDYLNGQEIPTIRRMETPGQLGLIWDMYLDWGINVMDFRGAVKNSGIEVKSPLE